MLKKLAAAGIVTGATAGVMMLGSPANADVIITTGTGDVLSGNQVIVPVNVCSNRIRTVHSIANTKANCRSGESVRPLHHHFHPLGY